MKKKQRCRWCNKTTGKIAFFIVADDMENPKPYHKECVDEMAYDALTALYKIKGKKI